LSCSAACHSRVGPLHCQAISRVFRFFGSTAISEMNSLNELCRSKEISGSKIKIEVGFPTRRAPSTGEQTREYRLRLSFLAFHERDPISIRSVDQRACALLCSCHKIHSTKSTLWAKHMNQFEFSVRQLMRSLRIYRRGSPIAGG
jgi:hypothetical protein